MSADPGTGAVRRKAAPASAALAVTRIRPAYEQVAAQLRELILSGEVAPGDRLPVEGQLSAEFGVSRSTVREAIRLLSSQSMLHTVRGPTGGTFVSAADPSSLRAYLETSIGLLSSEDSVTVPHLLEVRELLEVPAARLAAHRRSDEDLEAMHTSARSDGLRPGRHERFERNQQFHVQVLTAARNPLLAVVTEPVFRVIQSRFLKDEDHVFFEQVNEEHAKILDCIVHGDSEGAGETMHDHLVRLREVYGERSSH